MPNSPRVTYKIDHFAQSTEQNTRTVRYNDMKIEKSSKSSQWRSWSERIFCIFAEKKPPIH